MSESVSIIILTYNGGETFAKCLDAINNQQFSGTVDVIVIDSGSTDGSVEVAKRAGSRVTCIANKDFHHSRTRNWALQLTKYEKIIYLVQDAIPASNKWLSDLCESLDFNDVASVSVRQIPHEDADLPARFETEFHGEYLGPKPVIKVIESNNALCNLSYDKALHTIRHDNVCSIYRRSLLEREPFPDVEFAEDMAWACTMLSRGYKILYDPRIMVRHSHNRTPEYRFKRAVIDSIACAKILGRVKDDISCITVPDLMSIASSLQKFSSDLKKLHSENFEHIPTKRYFISNAHVIKLSLLITKVSNHLKKLILYSGKPINVSLLQMTRKDQVGYIMSLIADRYSISSSWEYNYCLDQVVASTIGRIYGEFYAGHMLKGDVPDEVEALIKPFLGGV